MTSNSSIRSLGGVAPAAICRAVLIARAAVVMNVAAAGLLLVEVRWPVLAVLATVGVAAAAMLSALSRWPWLVRHPWLVMLVDLSVALLVLGLSGVWMAFFWYLTGSAALAGALLGMRALPVWAVQAAIGFTVAATVLRTGDPSPEFTALVAAFPTVGVLAGLGASAATGALVRYVDLSVEMLAAAQRSAAASERARLARELHDSVSKTLRGVSFAALALPSSLRRHPALAERLAATVSHGAQAAAREARELMEGLRADRLDRDFAATVRQLCHGWSTATSIVTTVDAAPVEPPVPVRYELVNILREALRNVERHAGASRVLVTVRAAEGRIVVAVHDDGTGFTVVPLTTLHAGGHYGIVGMTERARAAGGALTVRSAPGGGTTVTVRVPA